MDGSSTIGSSSAAVRRIWLCADDYGISLSVNAAIRDLVTRGRLNATSVMVVAPTFCDAEAAALDRLNASGRRVAIGLHVTLTQPFKPLTAHFRPLRDGAFLPLQTLLVHASLRRLDRAALAAEVSSQIGRFVAIFGRPPDFIDGHQHVQLFPQIRDAVLEAAKAHAPAAWIRQCGRVAASARNLRDHKAVLLDVLSRGFRRRAGGRNLRTNPAFAGTYEFNDQADFATMFPRFLDGLPDGAVVMCHPGFVDAELESLDPLTSLREREYAYFADDAFARLLASRGIVLA
jgi:predicted glycoside hydrolase/deacetylase ChbG (UPF0249 family)